jgi:hypothetical protein
MYRESFSSPICIPRAGDVELGGIFPEGLLVLRAERASLTERSDLVCLITRWVGRRPHPSLLRNGTHIALSAPVEGAPSLKVGIEQLVWRDVRGRVLRSRYRGFTARKSSANCLMCSSTM